MAATDISSEIPFHLRGNYAPVTEEVTAVDLPVRGGIPLDLVGRYLRNGPNPRTGYSPHWFLGDGMVHGVELAEGRACWYRNRWVRNRRFLEQVSEVGPDGGVDLRIGAANTHVICHAGRILALVESSFPNEITAELDTVGVFDFDGNLRTAMTAHPKRCPLTGELHFFGYGFAPPLLTYHVADADGNLVHSEEIDVPGPTMHHDFNLTESKVVFMDLPVVFDMELAVQQTMPYRWSHDYGARLGVLPRRGTNGDVTWVDIEPCYVFHPLNAFDRGDEVVVDVCRYPELWRSGPGDFSTASLHRWTIHLPSGKVSEEPLDDRPVEFPRVDDRRVGLPHRHGYTVHVGGRPGAGPTEPTDSVGLVKYDLSTGKVESCDFGPGRVPGEAVFVAASDGDGDDEGWLLTYVYDAARDSSDFVILDANDIAGGPVATVELPQRVPFGFHGSWIADG